MTLTFSQEFLRQRSFEVAWAVFRIAEFVSKKNLKNGLEERALDYFLKKDTDSLDSLEDAIQFSFKIGEISEINAKVLFREINNLRSAIAEILTLNNGNGNGSLAGSGQGNGHSEQKISELAPAIEDYFSKLQLSDFCEEESGSGKERIEKSEIKSLATAEIKSLAKESFNNTQNNSSAIKSSAILQQAQDEKIQEKSLGNAQDKPLGNARDKGLAMKSPANENELSREKNIEIESEINLASLPEKSLATVETNSSAMSKIESSAINMTKNPADHQRSESDHSTGSGQDNQNGGEYYMSYRERQNAIMGVLNSRPLCHINDILSVMPGVSARTVRYDIQRMSDNGVVERIGNGGPSSFVRLKR